MLLVLALQVTLAAPQPIVELDTGKLKGEIVQLAWSPDGSEFYVQTVDRDRMGNVTGMHHYVVSASNKSVKGLDVAPQWATKYWAWKAAQSAPGAPSFRLDIDQHEETLRMTAAPNGGALAKGGSADPAQGTTMEEAANAANQTQVMLVRQLKLKGDTLGTWVNEPVLPGFAFSWAPQPLQLIAFAKRDKKDGGPIVVADASGQKQELAGPKNAILPAWSDDGKHLAWLERKDKKKFQLLIADISVS
jgi:hypothetical protein